MNFSKIFLLAPLLLLFSCESIFDMFVTAPGGSQSQAQLSDTQVAIARDQYEPDNNISQARTFSLGNIETHSLTNGTPADEDWVKFKETSSQTREVIISEIDSNKFTISVDSMDLKVQVFQGDINQTVALSTAGWMDFTFNTVGTNTYYIRFASNTGKSGVFNIQLK